MLKELGDNFNPKSYPTSSSLRAHERNSRAMEEVCPARTCASQDKVLRRAHVVTLHNECGEE